MSKLLENKQVIHVATEIVVLIGIMFYFSSKNKKLVSHIEDLSQRLEDQEDLIQKHEQVIKQLVQTINSRPGHSSGPPPAQHNTSMPVQQKHKHKSSKSRKKKSESPPPKPANSPPRAHRQDNAHVSFSDNEDVVEHHSEDYSSEDDRDLDAEIADELEELQDQDSLKKRN